jgi:AhpD family alkylhydroperoxidase
VSAAAFNELSTVGRRFALGQEEKDDAWVRASAAAQTTRCGFCGATHEGTAADGLAWAQAHRLAKHPQAKDRGQHARNEAKRKAKA